MTFYPAIPKYISTCMVKNVLSPDPRFLLQSWAIKLMVATNCNMVKVIIIHHTPTKECILVQWSNIKPMIFPHPTEHANTDMISNIRFVLTWSFFRFDIQNLETYYFPSIWSKYHQDDCYIDHDEYEDPCYSLGLRLRELLLVLY